MKGVILMLDKYIITDKRLYCEAEILNTMSELLIKEYVMSSFITESDDVDVNNKFHVTKGTVPTTSKSSNDKPSILERIKNTIVRAWKAITGFFGRLFASIRGFFKKDKDIEYEDDPPYQVDENETFQIDITTGEIVEDNDEQPAPGENENRPDITQTQNDTYQPDPDNPEASTQQRGELPKNDQELEQENQRLLQEIEQLEEEKKKANEKIEALKKENETLYQAIDEAMEQQNQQQTPEQNQSPQQEPAPQVDTEEVDRLRIQVQSLEQDKENYELQIKDLQDKLTDLENTPVRDDSQGDAEKERLQSQINDLLREKQDAENRADALEDKINEMNGNLSDKERTQLQQDYQRQLGDALVQKDEENQAALEEQKQNLESQFNSEKQSLETEIENLKQQLQQLEDANTTAVDKYNDLQTDSQNKQQELQQKLQNKKNELDEFTTQMKDLLNEKQKQIDASRQNNKSNGRVTAQKIAQLRDDVNRLKQEKQQAEDNALTLQRQIQGMSPNSDVQQAKQEAYDKDQELKKKLQELQQAQQELQVAQQRGDDLQNQLDTANTNNQQLSDENARLNDQLDEVRNTVTNLEQQLRNSTDPQKTQQLKDQIAEEKQKAADLQQKLQASQDELTATKNDLATERQNSEEWKNKAQNMQATATDLLQKLQDTSTQLNTVKQVNEQLKDKYNQLLTNFKSLRAQNADNEAKVQQLESEVAQYEQRLNSLQQENEQLRQENADLKEKLEKLTQSNALLEQEKRQLQQDLDKAKQTEQDLQKQAQELQEIQRQQKEEITSLQGKLTTAQDEVKNKENQIKELEQRARETSEQNASEKAALNSQLEELQRQLAVAQKRAQEAEDKNATLSGQNAALTQQLAPYQGLSETRPTVTKYSDIPQEMRDKSQTCEYYVKFDPKTKKCTTVIYRYHVPQGFMEQSLQLINEFHNYLAGITRWLQNCVGDQASNETKQFSYDSENSGPNGKGTLDKAKYQMDTILQQLEKMTSSTVTCIKVRHKDFDAQVQQLNKSMEDSQKDFQLANQYIARVQQIQDDRNANGQADANAKQNSKTKQLANIMQFLQSFMNYEKRSKQVVDKVLKRIKQDEQNAKNNAKRIFEITHGGGNNTPPDPKTPTAAYPIKMQENPNPQPQIQQTVNYQQDVAARVPN